MASVSNLSLGGLNAGGSDQRNLFLKVFSGEVLNAYERAIKVSPLLTTRTITSGKSAQFPTTGVAAARYFTPGQDLLVDSSADSHGYLSNIKQSERIIYIDNLLTANCFIDQLDEAMSHYDYRSAFATELGRALARHQDNYALYTLQASAVDVGDINGANEQTPGEAHTPVDATTFYTSASNALDAIYDAARTLDEADIPKDDRFVIMPPIAYYNLLKAGVLTVGGISQAPDARPQVANGPRSETGMMVAGMPLVVTNADGFTSADDATDGSIITDTKGGDGSAVANAEDQGIRNLHGTMSGGAIPDGQTGHDAETLIPRLAAMVCHKGAAGVVKLKDLTMESEYIIERQGTLMVAKLAQGMGALRNDACIAITTKAS